MSPWDGIVKTGEAVLSPILGNQSYIGFRLFQPFGAASTSVIPISKHSRLPGPSVPCAFLKSWQTWRWRGQGKAAEFGQYGRRLTQSARGSCLSELL